MTGADMCALEATKVATPEDAKETLFAPSWIPTIRDQPVRNRSRISNCGSRWVRFVTSASICWTIVGMSQETVGEAPRIWHRWIYGVANVLSLAICTNSPTDNFYGMTTHESCRVRGSVHTTTVKLPILVDIEANRDRSIGHDFRLHLFLAMDRIRRSCDVLVSGIRGLIRGFCAFECTTGQLAPPRAIRRWTHGVVFVRLVMIAKTKLIRLACRALFDIREIATSNNTSGA